jgi:ABC-type antimicrobial peptide transport system permease subunit
VSVNAWIVLGGHAPVGYDRHVRLALCVSLAFALSMLAVEWRRPLMDEKEYLLAALGIYGVLSYSVTQRTRELAVRSALGAQRAQLLQLVFRAGLRVVMLGMLFGVIAALALTRLLQSMLVEVDAIDAVSFLSAIVALVVVAFVAILVPAVRATRLDPLIALQAE